MMSCGWLWMYFGAFLMLAEILVPGFIVFFFGLAAMTVGVLRFIVGEVYSPSWQFASFSVLAIVYLLLLRKWVSGIFSGFSVTSKTDFGNESLGRTGKVTEAIQAHKAGRVMLGDAEWTAVADAPIEAGKDVRVVSQDNLTMKVEEIV